MSYLKSDYDLIDIQISKVRNKKYDALIRNKRTGEIVKVSFGSRNPLMQQYRDTTPLKYYKVLDHNDQNRKKQYQQRFKSKYNPDYYSSTSLSWEFLWS